MFPSLVDSSLTYPLDTALFWLPSLLSLPAKAGLTSTSASAEHRTLQVVCPSYGRTGTKSMQAALHILGFGPCYHSECCQPHPLPETLSRWIPGHLQQYSSSTYAGMLLKRIFLRT